MKRVTKEKNSIAEILRNKKSRKLLRMYTIVNRITTISTLNGTIKNMYFKRNRVVYVVQPETEATSTETQRLLMWGCIPRCSLSDHW